jgi:hypothetical protein
MKAAQGPDVREKVAALGAELVNNTPEAAPASIRRTRTTTSSATPSGST